jgi:uncharacterized membrane protein YkgB
MDMALAVLFIILAFVYVKKWKAFDLPEIKGFPNKSPCLSLIYRYYICITIIYDIVRISDKDG